MLIPSATFTLPDIFWFARHRRAPIAAFGRLPIDRWALLLAMACLLAIAACARAAEPLRLRESRGHEVSALSRAWGELAHDEADVSQDPDASEPPLPAISLASTRAILTARQDESLELPNQPIGKLGLNIRPPEGDLPKNVSAEVFADQPTDVGGPRHFSQSDFAWDAPALHHGPLYFEEVNLERYGYSHGILQPGISAAHFFTRVPALPYLMAAQPARECVYTLGHYRPGDCVPRQIHWPPLCTRAGLAEAGVMTGLVFLIP